MFPVKDNVRTAHSLALALALALAAVAAAIAGLAPTSAAVVALLAVAAALFGPAVAGNLPALAALAAGVPGAFSVLAGSPRDALAAAVGALVACHLVVFPRARFLSLSVVPFFFTLVAVPSAWWAAIWLGAVLIAWPAGVLALAAGALVAILAACATRSLRRGTAIGYQ